MLAGSQVLSTAGLELLTALVLIGFGVYKIFNDYRHPRWVGMQVGMKDLVWWSFLMAMAHGAGLMIAPVLLALSSAQTVTAATHGEHATHAGHVVQSAGAAASGLSLRLGVFRAWSGDLASPDQAPFRFSVLGSCSLSYNRIQLQA